MDIFRRGRSRGWYQAMFRGYVATIVLDTTGWAIIHREAAVNVAFKKVMFPRVIRLSDSMILMMIGCMWFRCIFIFSFFSEKIQYPNWHAHFFNLGVHKKTSDGNFLCLYSKISRKTRRRQFPLKDDFFHHWPESEHPMLGPDLSCWTNPRVQVDGDFFSGKGMGISP